MYWAASSHDKAYGMTEMRRGGGPRSIGTSSGGGCGSSSGMGGAAPTSKKGATDG